MGTNCTRNIRRAYQGYKKELLTMTSDNIVRLTIIIVSYNTRDTLARCLKALHEPPPHVPHQIIVVDNASNDGTVDLIRQTWPSLQIIEMGFNAGF